MSSEVLRLYLLLVMASLCGYMSVCELTLLALYLKKEMSDWSTDRRKYVMCIETLLFGGD